VDLIKIEIAVSGTFNGRAEKILIYVVAICNGVWLQSARHLEDVGWPFQVTPSRVIDCSHENVVFTKLAS
jgi:hypothetical protein